MKAPTHPSNPWKDRFKNISKVSRGLHSTEQMFRTNSKDSIFGTDVNTNELAQQMLNDLGATPPLTVDGIIGPKSQAAIRTFQQVNNIPVTGNLDTTTLSKMGLSTSNAVASPSSTAKGLIDGLRASVIDIFPSFSAKFEGKGTNFMYTDSKGYVTSGIGNLIDPIELALPLPWRHGVNGPYASRSEIVNAWNSVKNAWPNVQSYASSTLSDLRLDDEGMKHIVANHLKSDQNHLRTTYPGYVNWPAEAQLALHSIAWAWGPAFHKVWAHPQGQDFVGALNQPKPDFVQAAQIMTDASRHEESINSGLIPRNAANRQLFANAALVQAKKGSYDTIYYPGPVVIAVGLGIATFLLIGMGLLEGWYYYKHGTLWIPMQKILGV
jgi:peptidoglycan hydrolase-like protein with peptidoglycan-binding domain